MYIPMIFFTIVIEKKVETPLQREARYLQQKAIEDLETKRFWQTASFPEYCTRP